jgi:ketosteroid isomerase-like protein
MRSIILVLLLAALPGLAPAQVTPAASAQRDILTVIERQAAAWNEGDIAGYMGGYWHSDSLLFTSGGSARRGWNETFEKYAKKYSSKELMGRLVFADMEVHPLGDSAAWVFGSWSLERAADRPHGLFTLVFRRIDGSWKIVHDHTSSAP